MINQYIAPFNKRSGQTLLLSVIVMSMISGQSFLKNPSFEGEAADATTPDDWMVCLSRSTPDILPGPWGVEIEAEDGETYVGLITREDGSTEHITQRIRPGLKRGQCYEFGVRLAHSDIYAGYTEPIQLRIWIGDKKCKRTQMIFDSPLIDNEEWRTFPLEFVPDQKAKYLFIEAIYPQTKENIKGNILIDHLQLKICNRA